MRHLVLSATEKGADSGAHRPSENQAPEARDVCSQPFKCLPCWLCGVLSALGCGALSTPVYQVVITGRKVLGLKAATALFTLCLSSRSPELVSC